MGRVYAIRIFVPGHKSGACHFLESGLGCFQENTEIPFLTCRASDTVRLKSGFSLHKACAKGLRYRVLCNRGFSALPVDCMICQI